MTFVEQFSRLAQDYDALLKALGVFAAPGGIWFWIEKYRNRIRIKVRDFGFVQGDPSFKGIEFELENIGSSKTSLEPTFSAIAYSLKERKREQCCFVVEGDDRSLSPHEPKRIKGWHNHREKRMIANGWYVVFTLPLTRGRSVRVRFRNSEFKRLGLIQFHWERLRFKWLGIVP